MVEHAHGTAPNGIVILGAICLAALVLPLSFSGGAVATPAIGRDLGGSPVALAWVTNAFLLTFGSTLMAAGTLADRYGRKRMFGIGIGAFTGLSLATALAPSVAVLDGLRAAQGLAAAAALAGGSAALAQLFQGHARVRAFGMLGTTFGIGLAFGPLLAGWLIETAGWRAAFLSSAGVGAVALVFGVPRMQESRDPAAAGLDWPGTITFTAMLSLLTFGVILGPDLGWSSLTVRALMIGAVLFLGVFIHVEARAPRPMLDLSLFRYPRFLGVQTLPIATCACYVVLLVLLPLRFIGVEGLSPIEAGLLLLALSAPMLVVPMLAALLARRIPAGILAGSGLVIASGGLFLLGRVDPAAHGTGTLLPMLVIGIGAGLPWGLMDGLSVSVVPRERAGMATGIFSTMRVASEGLALAAVSALLAALAEARLRALPDPSAGPLSQAARSLASGDLAGAAHLLPDVGRAALVEGYAAAFQSLCHILMGITLLAALVVFAVLRDRPRDA